MAKLTKQDLAQAVATKAKIPLEQALPIVDIVVNEVAEGLLRGDKVEIRNFGILTAKLSNARMGRNLKNPSEGIPIPPQPVVKFRLGKRFRELLTRRFARAKAPK